MWRFKPFMPKEQAGLEGRSIDVGNLKIQVQNAIAEGGFSCVYLARDVMHPMKQYALKHIKCNDQESLELVMKEISVMKLLKGHPNVINLCAHSIVDMGRTKEAFIVMEFCEKSLVNVLESRGSGYFEEKQVLSIFRDICNAVFAMHCQSPPVAHRDLKAENLLLGSDGLWKLCDFGSTSTSHKRFEKPEEMGIEEDNIRKHTTPAYRAPEMWDLFRRELINEKVDIWALGCLLFRICYFKSAFDGESKLQVLNGNYRIPDLPKYNSSITDLIRDMLQSSPYDRPDITQIWFRVNEQLPASLQKSLPDRPPEMPRTTSDIPEGNSRSANKPSAIPRRSPPPPPSSKEAIHYVATPAISSKAGGDGEPLGAFWATQHAKSSTMVDNRKGFKHDEETTVFSTSNCDWNKMEENPATTLSKDDSLRTHSSQTNMHVRSSSRVDTPYKGSEMAFFQKVSGRGVEKPKVSQPENKATFQNETFNTFLAEFDSGKLSCGPHCDKSVIEQALKAEVERLKEQLHQANLERGEIASKYEKLSAICRSQRQEIQELKQSLAASTPSPSGDASRNQNSLGIAQREGIGGTTRELQQGKSDKNSQPPESMPWQAFAEEPKPQALSKNSNTKSVRTRSSPPTKQATQFDSGSDAWGFGTESFTAVPAASSQMVGSQMVGSVGGESNSWRFGNVKNMESNSPSQPAGWAGF